MIIKDIQDIHTGETRTDGRYPQRIGSTVEICDELTVGWFATLAYITDNQGNPKSGYLRTSAVTAVHQVGVDTVFETMNSRYILAQG